MNCRDIDAVRRRESGFMIDVIKDRPKGDAPENDRTLFVIDDVVTGIDKGFGDAWESFDGDLLVR